MYRHIFLPFGPLAGPLLDHVTRTHSGFFQNVTDMKAELDSRRPVLDQLCKNVHGLEVNTALLFGIAKLHKMAEKPEEEILKADILNLGSGPGVFETVAGSLGFHRVVGVDADPGICRLAASVPGRSPHNRVLEGDFRSRDGLPDSVRDSKFHYVVSNSSIHPDHFISVADMMAPRVRKGGGFVIRYFANEEPPSGAEFDKHLAGLGLKEVRDPRLEQIHMNIYQKTRDK